MTEEKRIATNLRTLLILEVVARHEQSLTATEIKNQVGLPKQTVHRLVKMLESEGFLIREKLENKYRPSRRSRLLASGLLNASRFHIVRHQILQDVSNQVKESVNFVVPEETGMHYLDRIETDWPFRIQLPRGSNVPFHCTASGKVFLASLQPRARRKFITSLNLERQTKSTLTDPEELLAELEECCAQGYSLDREEFIDEMVAIAVPVSDHMGRFVAALATHGPKQRMSYSDMKCYERELKAGSQRLSAAMFG